MNAPSLPPLPLLVSGRDDVLLAASDALLGTGTRDRAVALVGPRGIGKTTVALSLASRLAPKFADGQILFDAATFAPRRDAQEQIAARLVKALEPENEMRWGSIGVAQWLLRHRDVLVVIDGVEDVGQVLDLVPHRAWPSAMIITSRNALRLDVATFVLAPLSGQESTELLRRVSGDAEVLHDPRLSAELVRMTEGVPLTIGLLGALLARYPKPDPQLMRQLRNEATHSSFADVTALPPMVRAVLAVGYAQLRPESAALLRVIGLLPDERFTLAELQQAANFNPDAILELVAADFLERDSATYRTHPIVRRFIREQLSDQEPDAIGVRLGAAHLNAPDLSHVLRRHYAALPNMELERIPSDRVEVQEYALRSAMELGDQLAEARALSNLGALHLAAGRLDDAAAALRAAQAASDRAGAQDITAHATLALGHIERDLGSLTGAREQYEFSAHLFASLDDSDGLALALTSLGDVLLEMGDYERALASLQDALAKTAPDKVDIRARLEGRLAYLAQLTGDNKRARALYGSALGSVQDAGELGELLYRLAILEAHEANADTASELLESAFSSYMRAGLEHGATRAMLALGTLDVERGDLTSAHTRFEHAAELAMSGDKGLRALAAYGRGLVAQKTGRKDDAVSSLELALAQFREAHDRLGEAHALNALVESLRYSGHDAEMSAAEADAQALFDQLGATPGDPPGTLRLLTLVDR
jgi:tetratricopeptide (TPR) repeat protein